MTHPVVPIVAAVLWDGLGRVLLAQRPAHKGMPLLWEFPGGKIEKGENPEKALIRELYEEIGIVVSTAALEPLTFVSMPYPDFHIILLTYLCLEWRGTPYAREGQGSIEWVMPQDLAPYPMPAANHSLIPLLLKKSKGPL